MIQMSLFKKYFHHEYDASIFYRAEQIIKPLLIIEGVRFALPILHPTGY